jgi:RNA polymerase sigma-70 factor (sigma-E family)
MAGAYAKTSPVQPSRLHNRHASVDLVRSPTDIASFEDTFRTERARLVRLAHLLTGSLGVAEELVQDAFISLRARWEVVDNPAAYVRTAVVNLARSNQRRQRLERNHVASSAPPSVLPPELDETWRLIRQLPTDQRTVIVLRFYEDLSLAQIAVELDRPLGSVKSLLHRALKRLKEHMQ